jgi:hypothetical protein
MMGSSRQASLKQGAHAGQDLGYRLAPTEGSGAKRVEITVNGGGAATAVDGKVQMGSN